MATTITASRKKYIPPAASTFPRDRMPAAAEVERLADADVKLAYAHRTMQRLEQFLTAPLGLEYKRTVTLEHKLGKVSAHILETNSHGSVIHEGSVSMDVADAKGEPVAGAAGSMLQEAMASFVYERSEGGARNNQTWLNPDASQMMRIASANGAMSDYVGESMDLVREIRDEAYKRADEQVKAAIDAIETQKAEKEQSPPVNDLLVRMRVKLLTMTQGVLERLEEGAPLAGVDDLESYLTSLRQAGLTDYEMAWVMYIPTDSLPGFVPPS